MNTAVNPLKLTYKQWPQVYFEINNEIDFERNIFYVISFKAIK